MSGAAYYHYQTKARGLRSIADVDALAAQCSPLYDRLLEPWLPEDRQLPIYEVACGPGILLRYLAAKGYANVRASDSSEEQLVLTRNLPYTVVLDDSLNDLSRVGAESLACVLAIDFIEHLPKDVLINFLKLSHRVLRRGGKLILRAPNGDSPLVGRNLFNDITHFWAYTSVASRALLTMAGFTQVDFAEESIAAIQQHRWIKVPAMQISQRILRGLVRMATREDIHFWSPSIFIAATK